MKRLTNIIILLLTLFSVIGCFNNKARQGGFPYFNTEGVNSVLEVSHKAQTDAILSTQEEFNAFASKGYKEIRGNLIIGTYLGSGKTKSQGA